MKSFYIKQTSRIVYCNAQNQFILIFLDLRIFDIYKKKINSPISYVKCLFLCSHTLDQVEVFPPKYIF